MKHSVRNSSSWRILRNTGQTFRILQFTVVHLRVGNLGVRLSCLILHFTFQNLAFPFVKGDDNTYFPWLLITVDIKLDYGK